MGRGGDGWYLAASNFLPAVVSTFSRNFQFLPFEGKEAKLFPQFLFFLQWFYFNSLNFGEISVRGIANGRKMCDLEERKERNRDCNYLFKFSFIILCNLIAGIRIRNGEDRYWSYFFSYIYMHMWKNLNDDEFGLKKWSVWKEWIIRIGLIKSPSLPIVNPEIRTEIVGRWRVY